MKSISCDVAVIGAGSAGLAAHSAAVAAGAKVVMIDGGAGGTTCARCGCMPSKLLLAAANAARAVSMAHEFGIASRKLARVNGAKVMARVRRERDHFVKSVLKTVSKIPAREKLHGTARFVDTMTLSVGDHTRVAAKRIVIATGAAPTLPDDLAGLGNRVLTHETIFELKDLPKSIAVVGAGPLGIELAVAFARLGVRTIAIDGRRSIAGIEDPKVQQPAQEAIGQELELRLGEKFMAARSGEAVRLSWKGKRYSSTSVEYVLAATGRSPRLDNLDLQMSGLALDAHGVPIFDPTTMQCGDSPVFLAGDDDDFRPILHEASWQGERAGHNAAQFPKLCREPYGVSFAIAFTDPDVAKIGSGLGELKEDGIVGSSEDNGRARVDLRNAGILRIYARKSGIIAGAEMFGADVEHLAHLLAWAVQMKLHVTDLLALPFYHPTTEEGLRTALRDLKTQLR